MIEYKHTVQYYETDKMGIVHHSNYIRWMEEARVNFLDKIGASYFELEEKGIISPVTAIDCKYKLSTRFPETVTIAVSLLEYNGVRLRVNYIMKNEAGKTVFTGTSDHCFLDASGKIVRMDKDFPDYSGILRRPKNYE